MATFIKRALTCVLLMLLFNLPVLIAALGLNFFAGFACASLLAAFFIAFNIWPGMFQSKIEQWKLSALRGGYECMVAAGACFLLQAAAMALAFNGVFGELNGWSLAANVICFVVLLAILLMNGVARIFFASSQAGLKLRLALLIFWWFPVLNIIILRKMCSVAGNEYQFKIRRIKLNRDRNAERVCATKYPLLLVHGIFFRDWKAFNYWGRIPGELTQNGALVFYGGQQSSKPVEASAAEIMACVEKIVQETGCGKLNVIAHSKGGLDCRYAISRLGMGKHVASLTTVNTPHFGCNYARKLMEAMPGGMAKGIGKQYDALFSKLGDEAPDFLGGLASLTDTECARLNGLMPDDPNVLYQSAGSIMGSASSAPFPLNLGYRIIKPNEGDNDGLVSSNSMRWGKFLGLVYPSGKEGVSHGDMIDLFRKDIKGFDVCEFYINLAHDLKAMGL